MRVLIASGLKRGGTAGLADMIGDAFREVGFETVFSPATGIYNLSEFDAVVVVGAWYANRWHRDARRFVRRHTAALRELPVWLVSSGPLDDSAEHADIPPTKQVAKLANRIGARAGTGATKPTSGDGWTRWSPGSAPGTVLTRKPVTQADCAG